MFFKKFKKKNLIKNKKGDFAILGLIIIPVLVIIFTQIVSINYKTTTLKNNLQMSVDNISVLASREWGKTATIYDYETNTEQNITIYQPNLFSGTNSENNYCYKNNLNLDTTSFNFYFDKYIEKIDGFNSFWNYYMYKTIDDNQNETLTIELYYCYPANSDKMGVYDYYGIDTGDKQTGWYQKNAKSWNILKEKCKIFSFEGMNNLTTNERFERYNKDSIVHNSLNMICGVAVASSRSI